MTEEQQDLKIERQQVPHQLWQASDRSYWIPRSSRGMTEKRRGVAGGRCGVTEEHRGLVEERRGLVEERRDLVGRMGF